jgi:hypothetical protein
MSQRSENGQGRRRLLLHLFLVGTCSSSSNSSRIEDFLQGGRQSDPACHEPILDNRPSCLIICLGKGGSIGHVRHIIVQGIRPLNRRLPTLLSPNLRTGLISPKRTIQIVVGGRGIGDNLSHQVILQGRPRLVVVSLQGNVNDSRIPNRMQIPTMMMIMSMSMSMRMRRRGSSQQLTSSLTSTTRPWWRPRHSRSCVVVNFEMHMKVIASFIRRARTMQRLMNISNETKMKQGMI